MKSMFAKYPAEAAKMVAYRRARNEVANLPRPVALDLGIFAEDTDRIAREAVWR